MPCMRILRHFYFISSIKIDCSDAFEKWRVVRLFRWWCMRLLRWFIRFEKNRQDIIRWRTDDLLPRRASQNRKQPKKNGSLFLRVFSVVGTVPYLPSTGASHPQNDVFFARWHRYLLHWLDKQEPLFCFEKVCFKPWSEQQPQDRHLGSLQHPKRGSPVILALWRLMRVPWRPIPGTPYLWLYLCWRLPIFCFQIVSLMELSARPSGWYWRGTSQLTVGLAWTT